MKYAIMTPDGWLTSGDSIRTFDFIQDAMAALKKGWQIIVLRG